MINEIEINSDRFAQVRNARNTETAEDYTEMIADLIRETGEARAVDLAKHFGVTGPTVNSIIRRLVREGLVESRPYRSIFLTEKGKLLADYCKKRHEIVYNFLIKIGMWFKIILICMLMETGMTLKILSFFRQITGIIFYTQKELIFLLPNFGIK